MSVAPPPVRTHLSPSGLPPDLLARLPAHLRGSAYGAALMFFIALVTDPLRSVTHAGHTFTIVGAAFGVVMSLLTARIATSPRLSMRATLDLALAFEVGVGSVLWVLDFSTPFATTTHTPGVPTVVAWMMFFVLLVPLPLRDAVVANLLLVLTGPLVLVAFVLAGQPAPNAMHAIIWFLPTLLGGVIAVLAAHTLQRALHGLRLAREGGQYELLSQIGRGGMGEIHVARHRRLLRLAAVKTIRPDQATSQERVDWSALRQRFEREARITAGLRSLHTVELYDFDVTEDGTLYYAMELLEGTDLQALVERFGPLSPSRVVHLLLHATDSLAEAHERGLVHRDIKPSNLFVCRRGMQCDVLKVLDFGTVKELDLRGSDGMTRDGQYVGTPAFSAPEVAFGTVDARSDLYGLGAVAWWLLTGDHVFADALEPWQQIQAHRDSPVPAIADVTPLPVPVALEELVRRCLAKSPSDRPASALELARRLHALELPPWTSEQAEAWWLEHLPRTSPSFTSLGAARQTPGP